MRAIIVAFAILCITFTAAQVPQRPANSFEVQESDIDPLDLPLDIRVTEDSRGLQRFSNVCCSQCSRYSGSTRLLCFNNCQRQCFSERQCVNAGRGVYAGWCQTACSRSLTARSSLLTPRQCAGACSGQVQTLCRGRCNDLFPGCNASQSQCLSQASNSCFVG